MSAIEEIAAERKRQVEQEGWSAEHDDQHTAGEMATAAACYAEHAAMIYGYDNLSEYQSERVPIDWPWDDGWWKPKNPRCDLIRAAALIVAEIERLDRAESP